MLLSLVLVRPKDEKRVDEEIRAREWNLRSIFIFVIVIFILVISGRHFTLLDAILTQHEPFRTDLAGPRTQPGLVHISDNVTQIIPGKVFTQNELKQGRLPLWNPRIFCGMPHAADLHSQVFSITDTPFLLFMSVDAALGAAALLKLVLAGYFMYLFCRHLWIDRRLAFAAGALYALSSFTLAWLHFPSFLSTAMYYPLGLMLWDRYLTQVDRKLKRRSQLLLGIVMGLMILGGQLQLFANFILLALVYGFFSGRGTYEGSRLHRIRGIITPLLIGFAVGAIQLIPALELMFLSTRAGALEFNLITDIKALWESPALLFSLLGNLLVKIVSMAFPFGWSRALPANAQPFPEAVIYVGVTALLCFIAPIKGLRGVFDRFLYRFCFILIIINLFSLVLNSLFSFAGILEFLNPGRCAMSVAVLMLPLLAARRMDSFHKGDIGLDEAINVRAAPTAVVAFFAASLIVLVLMLVPFFQGMKPGLRTVTATLFYLGQFAVVVLLARHLMRAGSITGRGTTIEVVSAAMVAEGLLLAAVIAFPGARLTTTAVLDNSLNRVFAREELPFRVIRYQPLGEGDFKYPNMLVKRRSPILKPNEGMIVGIDDFQGYNSLNPRSFRDYVGGIDERLVINIRGSIDLYKPGQIDAPQLDTANVSFVLSEEEIDNPRLVKVTDEPVKVYRRPQAKPRVFFTGSGGETGRVSSFTYRPGRVKAAYNCESSDGYIVLSENRFPGWHGYLDGKLVDIVKYKDTPFMAISAPRGEHDAVFIYRPMSLIFGGYITLLGFAVVVLLWLLPSRRASAARRKGS